MNELNSEFQVIGIDIGGSHITAGLVDLKRRALVNDYLRREFVDCHASSEEILQNWTDTIKAVIDKFQLTKPRLGFAMPGPFDYSRGICFIKGFDKYESLYGMNIRKELAFRLSVSEENILFRNDAEAFLEGECFLGAGQYFDEVIGITLGTGLGSSIRKGGYTRDAQLSIILYNGEIIEEAVSTRGLLRNYYRETRQQLKDVKEVAGIHANDPAAKKAFCQFGEDLSWFLTMFIQQEKPEALVIGGNIVQAWELFMEQVIRNLKISLVETGIVIELPVIVKATLGESAALVGGACFHESYRGQNAALSKGN